MRLGAQPCQIRKGTLAWAAYRESRVFERHRHRYEFNGAYREQFAKQGMEVSGYLPGKRLAEILEIPGHPFFLGCQFHPELKSKPDRCHPLFRAFVKAALQRAQKAIPLRAEPAEARQEPAAAS